MAQKSGGQNWAGLGEYTDDARDGVGHACGAAMTMGWERVPYLGSARQGW